MQSLQYVLLTRVPNRRLEHQNSVVGQEIGDDESATLIDGFGCVHTGQET